MADNNVSSSSGDGDSGGLAGMFAAKIGAGAAKMGKKAAQSEAGRSASKAAVKGATDAATKDITDRFFRRGDYSSNPTPAAAAPATTSSTSSSEPSESTSHKETYHEDRPTSPESYEETRRNPPKPSVFQRFKPHINMKNTKSASQPTARPRPRQQPRQPGERKTYKHRLAKQPNWDKEAQAITLYNYRAEMKCDLEFRKGQVISIVYRTDDQNDWWEGKLDGKLGIFPANYVRLL